MSQSPSDTTSILTTYCAAESAGNNDCTSGLLDLDSVYTFVNGPRQDTTAFSVWVNRFGAPITTTDALGNETQIVYDGTWPGLASEVTDPVGHIVRAYYNSRGNPDSVVDVNPFGASGASATTRYEYDPGTDWLTRITGPEGAYATFTVDSVTGNRLTASSGSADSTTESFGYYTSGIGEGLLHTSAWPDGATTTLAYDALGNVDTVQTPKGYHTYSMRDAVGRDSIVLTQIDAAGAYFRRDSTLYDVMGRPTVAVAHSPVLNGAPSQQLVTHFFYDQAGRDTATTVLSSPDPNDIGVDTTRTHYDALGRAVAHIAADGNVDSVVFDPSGNAIAQITRLGGPSKPIIMQYDAVNRLRKRSVPSYDYSAESIGLGARNYSALWGHTYPMYPSDSGQSGYTVAAQVDTFAFDAAGRVTLANNRDAQVSRTYYPNGLMESETQRLRTLKDTADGGDFTHHVYAVSYQYDLAGRTTGITVPQQLAPRIQPDTLASALLIAGSTREIEDQIGYSYDAGTGSTNTGRLKQVTGLLPGETIGFQYTPRGQVAAAVAMAVAAPDGPSPRRISERWGYDLDGVVRTDTVLADDAPDDTLRAESFTVDAGGRILNDSDGTRRGSIMPTAITYEYSGMGRVLSSLAETKSQDGHTDLQAQETMTYDANGNWVGRANAASSQFAAGGGSGFQYMSGTTAARYAASTGRLRAQTFDEGRSDTLRYDAAGNLHAMITTIPGDSEVYNERVSYYGVDGRLVAADARSAVFGGTAVTGHAAFEEYRYDALGRRVLARVRRWCDDEQGTLEGGDEAVCMVSAIRRTVWNGSSELAEIQMPATDATPADTVENDTLAVQRHREYPSPDLTYDPNRLYGRVLYVPGLATDQPVLITRVNYADASDVLGDTATYAVYAPFSILPLWNAQGRADRAVFGGTAAPGADTLCVAGTPSRCAEIGFDRGLFPYARSGSDPGSWQGTILVDKPDATGTYYRRNRSYDPNTARFTQEDPLGLGGGLNLYGFANGDPVNTTDPFGLFGCRVQHICDLLDKANAWAGRLLGADHQGQLSVPAGSNLPLLGGVSAHFVTRSTLTLTKTGEANSVAVGLRGNVAVRNAPGALKHVPDPLVTQAVVDLGTGDFDVRGNIFLKFEAAGNLKEGNVALKVGWFTWHFELPADNPQTQQH